METTVPVVGVDRGARDGTRGAADGACRGTTPETRGGASSGGTVDDGPTAGPGGRDETVIGRSDPNERPRVRAGGGWVWRHALRSLTDAIIDPSDAGAVPRRKTSFSWG
jgi:hypothetical protein